MNDYPHLFSTYQLGSIILPNRIVLSPMTRTSADASGQATERMVQYYTRFAKGGFGLIITEGLFPDTINSQSYENQPGLATDKQADSWQPIVQSVQQEGGKIVAQLMHAGALVQHEQFIPRAPSAVQPVGRMLEDHGGQGEFKVPKEMSHEDIRQAIDSFAQAALRAKQVGFDGVEIHAANGYLLDQFITDYTNQRTDEYGGSIDRRIRIVVEVIQAIRRAVGPDYMVGVRISQGKVNDFHHKWANEEKEAKGILTALASAQPSYIHTTEYKAREPAFPTEGPTLAQLAKKYSHLPIIANGKLGVPEAGECLLESGDTDLVAIGTSALVNPDWPHKVQTGQPLTPFDHSFLQPIATLKEEEVMV